MSKRDKKEAPESPPEMVAVPEVKPAESIPPVPNLIRGIAQIPRKRWNVPEWLIFLAAWTGSKYGANVPGRSNLCGITPSGTMPQTEDGYAWFGNPKIGMDQFGQVCHSLGLDYSDPADCVKKLKARCPKIDTVSYTLFTEA